MHLLLQSAMYNYNDTVHLSENDVTSFKRESQWTCRKYIFRLHESISSLVLIWSKLKAVLPV